MQKISSFQYVVAEPTTKFIHPRQEIIADMVTEINESRKDTNYKQVTFQQINGMLRRYKGWDLQLFHRAFRDAKTPSAFFFWKLKQK